MRKTLRWNGLDKEKKTWILLASVSFFVGQEQLKFSTEGAPRSGLETGEKPQGRVSPPDLVLAAGSNTGLPALSTQ